MSDVPSDVLREILLRLPAVSLFRFKTVCKAWNRIITDPSFIRSHSINIQKSSTYSTLLVRHTSNGRLYSFSLDSLNYADGLQTIDVTPVEHLDHPSMLPSYSSSLQMASCNGLILLYNYNGEVNWVIWNPLTQELHQLPNPDLDWALRTIWSHYDSGDLSNSGFGYDTASDDYKVVRFARLFRGDKLVTHKFLVYSMQSGSWKIKNCPYEFSCNSKKGVFLNGALHWRSGGMILALDLSTGDFRQLLGPPIPIITIRQLFMEDLDVVSECLILSRYDHKATRFDGWVMNDYGVEKTSWMRLFSIEEPDILAYTRSLRPVVYLKSRGQVLLRYIKGFFWIDVENNSVKNVTIHGFSWISSYQFFSGSLFRLDDDSSSVVAKTTAGEKKKKNGQRKKTQRAETRLTFCVRNIGVPPCSDDTCCKSNLSYLSLCYGYDAALHFASREVEELLLP